MNPAETSTGLSRRVLINLAVILVLVIFAILNLTLRSYLPYDETRYISVAWEMWRDHSFLLPKLNNSLYTEKPPFLFWLIILGWKLFGVNDWWPRSIPFIFSLINLYLTRKIAIALWPEKKEIHDIAPLVLIAMPLWSFYSLALMFDMLVICFTLIGLLALINMNRAPLSAGAQLGFAIGAGFLTKGPVILVYVLPLILMLKLWNPQILFGNKNQILYFFLSSFLVAVGIIALWLIPVIDTMGYSQVKAVFLNQTKGRIVNATSHVRPVYWYLKFIPLVIFPWFYRRDSLPSIKNIISDNGLRFCVLAILPALFVFSLISSKQLHYLLPLFPPIALIFSYQLINNDALSGNRLLGAGFIITGLLFLSGRVYLAHKFNSHWLLEIPDIWAIVSIILGMLVIINSEYKGVKETAIIGLSTCILMICIFASMLYAPRPFTRIDDFAVKIAELQNQGLPVASNMSHSEQFEYLGRLSRPLEKLSANSIITWAKNHPNGYIVDRYNLNRFNGSYEILLPYRFNQVLVLLNSQQAVDNQNRKK